VLARFTAFGVLQSQQASHTIERGGSMSLAGALLKLGQQPADLRGARLVALHQPRAGISLAAGKLQTVHGLDSPHGKQPLAIQIHKGWFAPDGHSFKDRLHHLLQAAEPLVIALLAQTAVECDLGNASAS